MELRLLCPLYQGPTSVPLLIEGSSRRPTSVGGYFGSGYEAFAREPDGANPSLPFGTPKNVNDHGLVLSRLNAGALLTPRKTRPSGNLDGRGEPTSTAAAGVIGAADNFDGIIELLSGRL